MSLRKQMVTEATGAPPEIIIDDNSQEPESVDGRDGPDELPRHRRRRERETQTRPKEMTEEEMMDLALRLSEQEASDTALQLQREEEAVMKAIQESMAGQTPPSSPSQSQSLLAHASLRLCPRRKPLRSNGMRASAVDQGASGVVFTPEIDLTQETKAAGDEIRSRSKKWKRKRGQSPQLNEIESQASSGSSEPLDSQSSDPGLIHDQLLRKSPVFPSTDSRVLVRVPRLSRDLLETCRSSGFVLCSQDSSPQTSPPPTQPQSPTFPRSPGELASCPKSPALSETLQGEDDETQLTQSLEYLRSPVFGRSAERQTPPSACRPVVCDTSGMFSSQESGTSSVRTTSCLPQSPVFPRSTAPPPDPRRSSTLSEPHPSRAAEQSHASSSSRTGRRLSDDESVAPSGVERSNDEVNRAAGEESSQRPTRVKDLPSDPQQNDVRLNAISVASPSDDSQKTPENSAEAELTCDMVLVWSDEDEDVTPACSPSPVFPEERGAALPDVRVSSLNHDPAAPPGAEGRSSSTGEELQPGEGPCAPPTVQPTVHYYWGVPFCPRGLDPDAYTQVILAQMDVYDHSLKQAQRRLLRKAPWGDAILPQPEKSPSPESAESRLVPQRRGHRLRKKNQSEESPPAEAEEEEEGEQRDREEEEETEKESEGGEGEEDGRMDTDDCDVCPETQLSHNDDDETQDLTIDPGTELGPEPPELPEVQVIPPDDSPAVAEPPQEEEEEEEEENTAVCGAVERSLAAGGADAAHEEGEEVGEDGVDLEVGEVRSLQRPASPEVDPAAFAPSPEASVDCPICQGSFPVTRIERHAAYCDGEVSVLDPSEVSSKPRRKRRRAEVPGAEDTNSSVSSRRNQEKCFICQKLVPLREYNRHTELCILRRPPRPDTRGTLLSALEQTENRGPEAGPSGARVQPREVIDLRDDDDDDAEEEEGVRALSVSDSPIRSFTPISEATGCLIDFRRQQRAKKPSHRRR